MTTSNSKFEINRINIFYQSTIPNSTVIFQGEAEISGEVSYTYNVDPNQIYNKRYYDLSNAISIKIYKEK